MAIQPDGGGGGGGLSVENARTLMQEFALLNVDIPDLTITEVRLHPTLRYYYHPQALLLLSSPHSITTIIPKLYCYYYPQTL